MTENTIEPKPPKDNIPPNTIFIGQKPVMSYVNAIVMRMRESDEVLVKARGHAIPRAVDAVEVSRRRYFDGALSVGQISIGTEMFDGEEGRKRNVSTIEIRLVKKK